LEETGSDNEEMTTPPHVIVLGLGIAGSSIAATLAARGYRVTALEQFSPLHERGSSHGDTRIYRRVPHEGEVYVQMAAASLEGWHAWSRLAGRPLLIQCGGIDAGPEDSPMVQAALHLCQRHSQPHEHLSAHAFNRRFPYFSLPRDWHVVYQPMSGILQPDATRTFLHALARSSGATLLHNTPVLGIEPRPTGVSVTTSASTISADWLIVSAGSWLPQLFPELNLPLQPERRVTAWHRPLAPANLTSGILPAFILDFDGGWYGMPTPDGRLKMGHDKHLRQLVLPDHPPAPPVHEDIAKLAPCVPTYLRGFHSHPEELKSCIYTLAPDHHFLIDRHPHHPNILLFSCCSGHGFKFAPVYGDIAASILEDQPLPWLPSLAQFSLTRSRTIPVTRFSD
jgi:sarcosine oxidase